MAALGHSKHVNMHCSQYHWRHRDLASRQVSLCCHEGCCDTADSQAGGGRCVGRHFCATTLVLHMAVELCSHTIRLGLSRRGNKCSRMAAWRQGTHPSWTLAEPYGHVVALGHSGSINVMSELPCGGIGTQCG